MIPFEYERMKFDTITVEENSTLVDPRKNLDIGAVANLDVLNINGSPI